MSEHACDHEHECHHDHSHTHDHHGHDHGHHHPLPTSAGRLALVTGLNIVITAAELIGGLISGSLALVSDAVHNFGDGLAIVLAYIAARLSKRPSDTRHTFGWRRIEILTASVNGLFLVAVALYLLYEAALRWMHPEPIRGALVLIVAAIGLLANLAGAALLFKGSHENLNMRASYLHLLSDTISSVVVVVGGLLYMLGVDSRLDAILTAGLSVMMLVQGQGLLRKCAAILMQSAPDIDLGAVESDLLGLGLKGVHHVHVWQMDDHNVHFEAHVCVPDMPVSETEPLNHQISELLQEKYHIGHVVIQFETGCCVGAGLIVNCQ
jgi:cobalt-zinc-cadmium efflux system protein